MNSEVIKVEPMLCQDIESIDLFNYYELLMKKYIVDIKYNGVRALIDNDGKGNIIEYGRNGTEFNNLFEFSSLKKFDDVLLDGEIITGMGKINDFAYTNGRLKMKSYAKASLAQFEHPLRFIAFDILRWRGLDVSQESLSIRRKLLETIILKFRIQQPYSVFLGLPMSGNLPDMMQYAAEYEYEGVVIKKTSEPYKFGKREWLRHKFTTEEEVTIVGFTEANGARLGFGALVLENGSKVGQGFTNEQLLSLSKLNLPFKIRIKHFGRFEDGSYRNPVFISLKQ